MDVNYEIRKLPANMTPYDFTNLLREKGGIVGQDSAVKTASLILYNHFRGRSSVNLFAAPTGSGKTHIWRCIQKELGSDNVVIQDATQLTVEGYKGNVKISTIFSGIPEDKRSSILLVLDEADKMLEPQFGSEGTNYSTMLQNQLLRLCDHDTLFLGNDSEGNGVYTDTSGVSIVFLGAFERIMKSKSRDSGSIGFGRKPRTEYNYENSEITADDLIDFGMRPELAGRITRITSMTPLGLDELVNIGQQEVKNIEAQMKCEISADYNVIFHLACTAQKKGLGARKIKSDLNNILDDMIYENPNAQRYEITFRSLNDSYFKEAKSDKEMTL